MSHRDQALEFVTRFAAGDIDGLEPLLCDELRVAGPYLSVTSKAAYLQALRLTPPEPSGFRVLSVTEDGDAVAVFYDYEKGDRTLTVAQLFCFRGDRIGEIRLVFDGRDSA